MTIVIYVIGHVKQFCERTPIKRNVKRMTSFSNKIIISFTLIIKLAISIKHLLKFKERTVEDKDSLFVISLIVFDTLPLQSDTTYLAS